MQTTMIGDTEVQIGDFVFFKSDIEQCGKIKYIYKRRGLEIMLTLTSRDGFQGEYIGGDKQTDVPASICWVE